MRLPWGLYRRHDGKLAIAFKAFSDDSTGTLLSSHETRPDADRARLEAERRDETEALLDAGQKELW